MKILMLLPECDYDPTESAVPWLGMQQDGHIVTFASPNGKMAEADVRLTQKGFSLLSPFLMTRKLDIAAYLQMSQSAEFQQPLSYDQVNTEDFDALFIPGGHASGMKTMLESSIAQSICAYFMENNKPVAAVCHGVLTLARSLGEQGLSVLDGRKTTALPASMELSAWLVTFPFLGNYYRTYKQTVANEVSRAVGAAGEFLSGPLLPLRDSRENHKLGFTVRDNNYLSARWPGDCNKLSADWLELLADYQE